MNKQSNVVSIKSKNDDGLGLIHFLTDKLEQGEAVSMAHVLEANATRGASVSPKQGFLIEHIVKAGHVNIVTWEPLASRVPAHFRNRIIQSLTDGLPFRSLAARKSKVLWIERLMHMGAWYYSDNIALIHPENLLLEDACSSESYAGRVDVVIHTDELFTPRYNWEYDIAHPFDERSFRQVATYLREIKKDAPTVVAPYDIENYSDASFRELARDLCREYGFRWTHIKRDGCLVIREANGKKVILPRSAQTHQFFYRR